MNEIYIGMGHIMNRKKAATSEREYSAAAPPFTIDNAANTTAYNESDENESASSPIDTTANIYAEYHEEYLDEDYLIEDDSSSERNSDAATTVSADLPPLDTAANSTADNEIEENEVSGGAAFEYLVEHESSFEHESLAATTTPDNAFYAANDDTEFATNDNENHPLNGDDKRVSGNAAETVKPTSHWKQIHTLRSNDEYKDYLKLNNFSVSSTLKRGTVVTRYMRCNLVKQKGEQCAARISVRMPTNSVEWVVCSNAMQHTHDRIGNKISKKVCERIEVFRQERVAPAKAQSILSKELGEKAPTIRQVYWLNRKFDSTN